MDVWREVVDNWSELCAAMGCTRTQIPSAIAHTYPISRSGPFYNLALVKDSQFDAVEVVEDLYGKSGLPFTIVIPRLESYAGLEKLLVDHGYSLPPMWGLMLQEQLTGERNPEVKVDQIAQSGLNDWFALQDVFSHVQSSKAARLEMTERILRNESAQFLLATMNGKPVGAGLLYVKDHVASIHMIATRAEFRRKHVATSVTLEASRRARDENAELVWLRTRRGGTGEKVYSKIGFKLFADLMSYTRTLEFEDSNLPPK